MKKYIAAFAIFSSLVTASCFADSYTTDAEFSVPVFEISHLGFTTQHGLFKKTNGKISIDFTTKTGSVDFTIFTESLDMGWEPWTKHLSDEGLFNVNKFPTMTFKSNKLIFDGDKVVAADGQFTMIGVTAPLKVEVNNFQCSSNPVNKKQMCSGNVTATLKRSVFGLTKYIPAVSDEVKVTIPVEAYKD